MTQQIVTPKERDAQQIVMNLEYLFNLYGMNKALEMIKENKQGEL